MRRPLRIRHLRCGARWKAPARLRYLLDPGTEGTPRAQPRAQGEDTSPPSCHLCPQLSRSLARTRRGAPSSQPRLVHLSGPIAAWFLLRPAHEQHEEALLHPCRHFVPVSVSATCRYCPSGRPCGCEQGVFATSHLQHLHEWLVSSPPRWAGELCSLTSLFCRDL